ncbi:lysophospholipase-like protein 1 [Phodopus roborovskii]|uniref:Lysophospholipase-like protein 1 n=1 Tax=Phodopus roborovskii TaxID=109678 RepID=A0AAU9ZC27_PHORO|nr:lysophospholipase-like protein 1 [Phodopus roborovskii]CAH6789640.1 Lyplal1 [Phodopus roborovskii]
MAFYPSAVHLRQCVVSPASRHSASLIFLHGSGDSGQGLRQWIKNVLSQDLTFQHIKIIYPTAPSRPYTPMKGGLSNVWFDRFKISNDCPEHLESIDGMCQVLTELIDDEVKNGIQKNRILIGGFSMGGCMAIHLAYRKHQDVAGVFALSSFLNKESAVYKDLQQAERSRLPELFQCHGTADELVLHAWGEETNSKLRALGVNTVFHSLPNLYHDMNRTELERLKSWILTKLPGGTKGQSE